MKTKKTLWTYIALVIGVIVLVNILADSLTLRFDLTEDKRYSLSEATKSILENLNEPVTITAYFSEGLPPDIAKTKKRFKELLIEYGKRSDGMLVYEFKDPAEDEKIEQEAMKNGIQPVMINVREKNQAKQQKAFLGALIQLGEQKEVIPFMEPGAAMEYKLSSSIKKLTVKEKPTLGFLRGHGELPITRMQQARKELSILYNTEEVTLNDSTYRLGKYHTLAIIAPTDSFPVSHLQQLERFLAEGKNILLAYNSVEGDLQRAMGRKITTGLEQWMQAKGIAIEPAFIIDKNCGQVSVRQGNFPFPVNISFPYLPIISNFADHPVTNGLDAVLFKFASPVSYTGDTTIKFTPIAKTSDNSGTQSAPTYFNIEKQWTNDDFPMSGLTVAATIEGKIVDSPNALSSKMVIFGDGDFPIASGNQQQLQSDQVSLLVSAIEWLSDETGLIQLRNKGISFRPLKDIEEGKQTFLKYFNFLLPILIIIIYGIIRMQYNRNLRIKRMEEDYV